MKGSTHHCQYSGSRAVYQNASIARCFTPNSMRRHETESHWARIRTAGSGPKPVDLRSEHFDQKTMNGAIRNDFPIRSQALKKKRGYAPLFLSPVNPNSRLPSRRFISASIEWCQPPHHQSLYPCAIRCRATGCLTTSSSGQLTTQ